MMALETMSERQVLAEREQEREKDIRIQFERTSGSFLGLRGETKRAYVLCWDEEVEAVFRDMLRNVLVSKENEFSFLGQLTSLPERVNFYFVEQKGVADNGVFPDFYIYIDIHDIGKVAYPKFNEIAGLTADRVSLKWRNGRKNLYRELLGVILNTLVALNELSRSSNEVVLEGLKVFSCNGYSLYCKSTEWTMEMSASLFSKFVEPLGLIVFASLGRSDFGVSVEVSVAGLLAGRKDRILQRLYTLLSEVDWTPYKIRVTDRSVSYRMNGVWVSVRDLANKLGIDIKALFRWIKRGELNLYDTRVAVKQKNTYFIRLYPNGEPLYTQIANFYRIPSSEYFHINPKRHRFSQKHSIPDKLFIYNANIVSSKPNEVKNEVELILKLTAQIRGWELGDCLSLPLERTYEFPVKPFGE